MSNRRRLRRAPPSYSTRLQRRSPAGVPGRGWHLRRPEWMVTWLPAALAVIAEAGHLAAAYVEWPEATARGAYHVVAGGLLGLVAAAALTGVGRRWLFAAAAAAIAGPVAWLGGGLLGASPFRELAPPVAIGITASEVAVAVLLFAAASTAGAPAATSAAGRRTTTGAGARG